MIIMKFYDYVYDQDGNVLFNRIKKQMLANLISKIHLTTYLVIANYSPSDPSHNTVLLSKLCQHVSSLIYTMDNKQLIKELIWPW